MEHAPRNTNPVYNLCMSQTPPKFIRAAGGLVWRMHADQLEILLVHRPRYNDWTLPKGKLKRGERWEDAALREVAEETGLSARLDGFAGAFFYTVKEGPKVVLFWNMQAIGSSTRNSLSDTPDEVSEVAWLPVAEALHRMDYPDERELIQQESERLLAAAKE
jgi:ADP-ribose pyrophosphatase YjhB (NUDIX family)